MKKIAFAVIASIATLALSACGKSDDPNAQASAESVEMPAEEAVNSAEANAQPVADSATDAADGKATQNEKDAAAAAARDFEDLGGDKPAEGPAKAN